jgi:hypothetical protein
MGRRARNPQHDKYEGIRLMVPLREWLSKNGEREMTEEVRGHTFGVLSAKMFRMIDLNRSHSNL